MRKAFWVLPDSANPNKETIYRLEEPESKYTPRTMLTVDDTGFRSNIPRRTTKELTASSSAMDRVPKWPVKYDGDTNPFEFVERS